MFFRRRFARPRSVPIFPARSLITVKQVPCNNIVKWHRSTLIPEMTAYWRARKVSLWALALALSCASAAQAQPAPRRVLLLQSYEREFAPHNAFASMFRAELSGSSNEPIDVVEVSLQSVRFSRGAPDDSVVEKLRATLGNQAFDLVVPIGGPAAIFAQTHRPTLFPTTPMLLAAVDRRFVDRATLGPNDTAVPVDYDPTKIVDNILRLLPKTRTIVVVIGTSPLEQYWRDELKRGLHRFGDRVSFVWEYDRPFADMLTRSAALPADSAIFFAMLTLDAAGIPHVEERALSELRAAANAPIFGINSTQLGRGIVGGPLLSIEDLSRTTTDVALRLLHGEPPQSITPAVQVAAAPIFDWRELRRWGIPEDRLPVGSIMRFRQPTTWERHRGEILAGVSIAGAQAGVLIALLVSASRRRRSERMLRVSEERFRLLLNAAPVMIWTAGPDKLCTDFNRPWLDFTGRPIEAELGSGWTEAIHGDDVEDCLHHYTDAFDRREPFQMEYRLRRYDGDYRWILNTGVPRYAADGFAGYVGSAIDVTDVKLPGVALSGLSRHLIQAHEEEQARISLEIKESLCQRLMALNLQLHSLAQASENVDEMRRPLKDLCREFGDLGSDMLAVTDPVYSKLDMLGLVDSSRILCQDMATGRNVAIEFEASGVPDRVPHDTALALFRVLQEALSNAVRHAGVDRISVSLRACPLEVRLEVADAGVGFDPRTAMKNGGLGLIAMRTRLDIVGGACEIESERGEGTRILARAPLRSPARLTRSRGDGSATTPAPVQPTTGS